MRARTVNEASTKTKPRISISEISEEIKNVFPEMKSLAFGILAQILNKEGHLLMSSNGKLSYPKLIRRLRQEPYWKRNERDSIKFIEYVAPMGGFVNVIPGLDAEKRANMRSLEKVYTSDLSPEEFRNAEIDQMYAGPDDYMVRNLQDSTDQPAFYHFEKEDGTPRKLNQKEHNFLRRIYTEDHGTIKDDDWTDKNQYYMYVSPILIKNAEKWDRMDRTGFKGDQYN